MQSVELLERYSPILPDPFLETWTNEVWLWRKRIEKLEVRNSLEALGICDLDAFSNVHQVLDIIAVLPVSTSVNERSFSTLRRLKAYLRFTMKEDRLNRPAFLNIHRNLELKVDSVLNDFFCTSTNCAIKESQIIRTQLFNKIMLDDMRQD
nr:unnamed protein product [Callosobruchus analis]